ncbi:hypothetical protein Pcinc_034967 [Petrolisthes cinctipes]|uniref:Uncharacterized protein n=1 Tax=Petrolisthes cinctipes TaxID=88211 RepID=A0AAE1BXP3_PETCI|nr:hypothetical protein Pcinc_034967 [Petrolisthes cinctipes]
MRAAESCDIGGEGRGSKPATEVTMDLPLTPTFSLLSALVVCEPLISLLLQFCWQRNNDQVDQEFSVSVPEQTLRDTSLHRVCDCPSHLCTASTL